NIDNTATKLSNTGIPVNDMPVYKNKEGVGIKMGYSLDFSLDTIGFENSDSSIKVSVSFYGMDNANTLTPVKIFALNKSGKLLNIADPSSDYYLKSKEITLDRKLMKTPDALRPDYNTWYLSYFLPYNAKIVSVKEPDPGLNYKARFKSLLVIFNITGNKNYAAKGAKMINFSKLENSWGIGDGSEYGQSFPIEHDLLTEPSAPEDKSLVRHGQVFWYDLTKTVMDDVKKGRTW
ncbi:MAG: hypothetical protein Q8942_16640, partial [Bacillota bacterium]|nr:hypothetical protein [Bacillota bacterium]